MDRHTKLTVGEICIDDKVFPLGPCTVLGEYTVIPVEDKCYYAEIIDDTDTIAVYEVTTETKNFKVHKTVLVDTADVWVHRASIQI